MTHATALALYAAAAALVTLGDIAFSDKTWAGSADQWTLLALALLIALARWTRKRTPKA